MPAPAAAPDSAPRLTARLLLRPYAPDDAEAFFTLIAANRPRLRPSFPAREAAASSVEASGRLLAQFGRDWRSGRLYVLGIWHCPGGRYLGDISLKPNWTAPVTLEIGYYLAAEAEGQGFAREALAAAVAFGFDTLGAARLLIRCRPDNPRSVAVAEALGFQLLPVRPRPSWLQRMLGSGPPVLYYMLKR
ncbi:GNAT family N-acetyltransferase [Hymenobacter actinosclerus]|uniref:Acetyltransferase (GNAT) domain-containing protein n=1 Tax=Hymenobacter actinosclerus TaxID=82805 RepID=A0A1I0H7J7_9BACT|nr:GNAT family protein [Hymenobacter actinosclerus]SET79674.1 Acetyltransferase (GNAT) domain-containing protein [Hymenobacter actinosclerus]